MTPMSAAYALWIAFVVAWQVAARFTARATSRASAPMSLAYLAGYVVGFSLLFTPVAGATLFGQRAIGAGSRLFPGGTAPLWDLPDAVQWLLVLIEAGLFGFGFWARAHLGRLWSGMMTLREGHHVVDTGPYRLVRHPIYTTFIGAGWMLALIVATPVSLIGAAALTLVMSLKAKAEERLLRRELGADAYDAYAARTPMLVPLRLR